MARKAVARLPDVIPVPRQQVAALVVLAARYGLARPAWPFVAACRSIVDHAAALGTAERTILAELLTAHEPPVNSRDPECAHADKRRHAWLAARAAVGATDVACRGRAR